MAQAQSSAFRSDYTIVACATDRTPATPKFYPQKGAVQSEARKRGGTSLSLLP